MKIEPRKLNDDDLASVAYAHSGNPVVHDLLAHIAALEAELAAIKRTHLVVPIVEAPTVEQKCLAAKTEPGEYLWYRNQYAGPVVWPEKSEEGGDCDDGKRP